MLAAAPPRSARPSVVCGLRAHLATVHPAAPRAQSRARGLMCAVAGEGTGATTTTSNASTKPRVLSTDYSNAAVERKDAPKLAKGETVSLHVRVESEGDEDMDGIVASVESKARGQSQPAHEAVAELESVGAGVYAATLQLPAGLKPRIALRVTSSAPPLFDAVVQLPSRRVGRVDYGTSVAEEAALSVTLWAFAMTEEMLKQDAAPDSSGPREADSGLVCDESGCALPNAPSKVRRARVLSRAPH